MKVKNKHKRTIPLSKDLVGKLLDSLASEQDKLWPSENWPRMYLDKGLALGSDGGHKPIKYEVIDYLPGEFIKFKFKAPKGFNGFHYFRVKEVSASHTEIEHVIEMKVKGKGVLTWYLAILHLHNALIRDLMAKAQASLELEPDIINWNLWVKILRWSMGGGKSSRQIKPNKYRLSDLIDVAPSSQNQSSAN